MTKINKAIKTLKATGYSADFEHATEGLTAKGVIYTDGVKVPATITGASVEDADGNRVAGFDAVDVGGDLRFNITDIAPGADIVAVATAIKDAKDAILEDLAA